MARDEIMDTIDVLNKLGTQFRNLAMECDEKRFSSEWTSIDGPTFYRGKELAYCDAADECFRAASKLIEERNKL